MPLNGSIWDITDPLNPIVQQYDAGTMAPFSVANNNPNIPNQIVVFDPTHHVLSPTYEGFLGNQNFHALHPSDLIIIYYDEYENAALKLAEQRRSREHLEVLTIPVSQVFQEFGGGSKDPSAIRDFARMIYKRDPEFRYLLLLGDATYDYQNRSPELPYHNFIPAFETEESLDPIRSFPSDDYFGLLDDNEGEEGKTLIGAVDIAIGRLPSDTPEEADGVVE